MTNNDVAARFNQAMIHTYQEALKIGYRPTRFLQMVNEHGGVETARIILAQANTTDGFGTLWEKQRLDLSVEALILQPDYDALFTAEDKAKARARLAEVNYTAPWDSTATPPPATVLSTAPSLIDRLARAVESTQQSSERTYVRERLEPLIVRFQQRYASFSDQRYNDQERFYKDQIADRMRTLIGRQRLSDLIAAGDFEAAKTAIKQCCTGSFRSPSGELQRNNLLNQWDMRAVLDAPAEPLARRLFDLLYGDGPFGQRFDVWVDLLSSGKSGVWQSATYFLMLHDPTQHLLIKPAQWHTLMDDLGIESVWQTRPHSSEYVRLQQIAVQLRTDLAPLGAQDLIDVQSFLWVINGMSSETWIFQSNPANYDLPGALRTFDQLRWLVNRYRDEIKPGHTVYLWEAGTNAGVLAVTTVLDEPSIREDEDLDVSFYRNPANFNQHDDRVTLQIEHVLPHRIQREQLRSDPVLRELTILKQPQGTNFRVSIEQARALAALAEQEDAVDRPEVASTDLEKWRNEIITSNPLAQQLVNTYPNWLIDEFGPRLQLLFSDHEIYISLDGQYIQRIRININKAPEAWFVHLNEQQVALLRIELDQPTTLNQKPSQGATYPHNWRFNVVSEHDLNLVKTLMLEIARNPGTRIGRNQSMSIADAAHTILTRAGGGPLHLSEILKQIQDEELATMRGQTPQLSLASIMLRDERFQNLGRNTWILAASAQDEQDTEDDSEAVLVPAIDPPTRQPKIYAESDAQFWRIHFPRDLWTTARRAGVIAIGWPLDSGNQSVKRFHKIRPGDRIVAYVQGGAIGGIGIAISAFDPENPSAGLPADVFGEEYNQVIRVAWADAPAEAVDLLDALRHPNYTQLYNRIKNPHTVIPLSRDDYTLALSLLQVDDIGSQSESRLPNALIQLAAYLNLAVSLGSAEFESTKLVDAARALDPPAAEPLDADDLVAELLQLRLIEASSPTSYRLRDYVTSDRAVLLKLCALAVLMPVEGTADQYMLPARAILPRLRTASSAQPADRFAPELGADGLVLLGWYAEAGLVEVEDDSWHARADTLDLGVGTDRASQIYRSFLRTLLADIDGVLETDLAHVAFDAPLPSVTDFDARVRLLGQELLFDTAIVRRVYRSLLAGRHVVLSGPPGTGKTELARLLPSLLWGEEPRVYQRLTVSPSQPPVDEVTVQRSGYASVIVTATEDWGVRDVVGGIGPRLNAQSGLSYTIEHGALTRVLLQHYDGTEGGRRMPPANAPLVRRDHRPTDNQRYRGAWLVIDEFTRAPIDAAFGSLLTTLSGSEHAKLAVPTASGELREVPLPRDFRIIGTLNSFDRHFLNQISEAMKRRFDFIDVLPPPPSYAVFEQGIAAKQALSRLQRQGFTQITSAGDPATYTWPQVLQVVPMLDSQGLQRYHWQTDLPEADAALTSFWRLFSAIRVFRQLGTAQIVAIYMNLLTGILVDMNWQEALDTALADALADQLQVLNRDEQQIIEAFVRSAGAPAAFCTEVRAILSRVPPGRRLALRAALRDADQLSHAQQQSDIALDQTALTDEQIGRVFALGAPLALPPISVFQRRLRDLAGERGL